jgi:hypothetical protein
MLLHSNCVTKTNFDSFEQKTLFIELVFLVEMVHHRVHVCVSTLCRLKPIILLVGCCDPLQVCECEHTAPT